MSIAETFTDVAKKAVIASVAFLPAAAAVAPTDAEAQYRRRGPNTGALIGGMILGGALGAIAGGAMGGRVVPPAYGAPYGGGYGYPNQGYGAYGGGGYGYGTQPTIRRNVPHRREWGGQEYRPPGTVMCHSHGQTYYARRCPGIYGPGY